MYKCDCGLVFRKVGSHRKGKNHECRTSNLLSVPRDATPISAGVAKILQSRGITVVVGKQWVKEFKKRGIVKSLYFVSDEIDVSTILEGHGTDYSDGKNPRIRS